MALDIEREVARLYEAYPYPNWRNKLEPEEVRRRLQLLRNLELPVEVFRDACVLDAGCGTGEKTIMMATWGSRLVVGVDRSLASLGNASAWARSHGIDNVAFVQGDVLDLSWLPSETFDVVHCTGVLHHTPDPARGFGELVRVLRPGGYCILFVYNPYGRAYIRLKRAIVTLMAGRGLERRKRWAARLFRGWQEPNRDASAVYHDFYSHPHESYHSIGETLRWLDRHGLRFHAIYRPLTFRKFCRAVAETGRPGPGSSLAAWLAKRLPPDDRPQRRPGALRRGLVQALALIYVLANRTHVGWAVVGRKPEAES